VSADAELPLGTGDTSGAPARPSRNAAATRARILKTATREFASKGLQGTRIDEIARRAACNKAMIYHYFASKDALFAEVLEQTYRNIRSAERKLRLEHRAPLEAMGELVGFSFDYVSSHPEFISLINDENLHGGMHVRHSARARNLNSPLVATIDRILRQGARQKVFREGIDPVQLYISIASLCYFYVANRHTLSAIFDLQEWPTLVKTRRTHVIEMVIGYLRPAPQEKVRHED
jgi:TetR/AcrR family transcriptional regulator